MTRREWYNGRTSPQIKAFEAIVAAGGLTVPELAAVLGTSPAGAARTASSMVRLGFIQRGKIGKHVAYCYRPAKDDS